jgi:hypothetical protein
MLPFSAEQFFAVFAEYNAAVWPAQVVAYALGAVAVAAALRGGHVADRLVASVLALMWLWTGVAYHWLAFAAIDRAAWAFGAFFVVEAALLVWFGAVCGPFEFRWQRGLNRVIGLLLVVYAAIIYPLFGYAAGHGYPAMPMFGITPCPVTIFTLGLLLLARAVPWPVLIVPVLWSMIGGTAAFLLAAPQDWLLLVSGPLAVVLLWRKGGCQGW